MADWIKDVEFPPPYADDLPKKPIIREDPDAEKAPVETTLRFGIDIDGTISRAPKHFKRLIDSLLEAGNLVFIITARDAGRRSETEDFLGTMDINYSSLIMKPIEWPDTIPDFKVAIAVDKDLHLMIDDENENCWAIEEKTRTLAVHMLPAPPIESEFK